MHTLFLILAVFPWQDLQVSQVNALPAHSTYYVYSSSEEALAGKPAGYFIIFCGFAYLVAWCVMKALVPQRKDIVL